MPDNWCGAHKRTLPCKSCFVAGEKLRKRWKTSRRYRARTEYATRLPFLWFDEEIQVIRDLAGKESTHEITRQVNEVREKIPLPPRSVAGVRGYAETHGIDLMPKELWSATAIAPLLGVNYLTVRYWHDHGWLVGKSWGKFHLYDTSEIAELIQQRPWLVDPQYVSHPAIRQVAEVASRRDPWLRVREVAKILGVSKTRILENIHKIPHQKRTGHNGAYMIQASVLPQFREICEAAIQRPWQLRRAA